MDCEICKVEIPVFYLEKKSGGVVKDAKGKKRWVCSACQSKHLTKDELLKQLGK